MALKARKVLAKFFQLQQKLSSVPSMTGAQLERVKNLSTPSVGSRMKTLEELQIAKADLSLLLTDLTKEELEVCELRCGVGAGKGERYKRLVKQEELQRMHFEGGMDEMVTTHGESLVGPARSADGNMLEGYVEVEGWRTRCLTYQEIATMLGQSFRTVRFLHHSACDKVRTAIKKRRMREALSEEVDA